MDTKRNRNKWKRHEEIIQLQVNDRPEQEEVQATIISAFAYASTPPLKPKTSRWKKTFGLIRPTSFLRNHTTTI